MPTGEADERGNRLPVPTGYVPGLVDEAEPAAGYVLVPTGFAAVVPAGGDDNGGRATHADGHGTRGGAMAEEVTGHAERVVQPIARRGLPRNHGPTVVATPMAFGVVGHEPFGVELGVAQRFGEAAHLVGRGGHERLARSLLVMAHFVAFLARDQGVRLRIR